MGLGRLYLVVKSNKWLTRRVLAKSLGEPEGEEKGSARNGGDMAS